MFVFDAPGTTRLFDLARKYYKNNYMMGDPKICAIAFTVGRYLDIKA